MTDRYRPTTFDEIVGQPTDEIEAFIDGFDTPNFLLYGPYGTGKTSTAYVIARAIQDGNEEILELNSSDDRGIDTVRDRINPILNQTTLSGSPMVVLLDEMDGMTLDAQEALRQPMEQGQAVFVLTANDLGSVHGALRSRCREYEFGPLTDRAIKTRIDQIAAEEGVELDPDHRREIVAKANGDMRTAIQRYTRFARGIYSDERERIESNSLERDAQSYLED